MSMHGVSVLRVGGGGGWWLGAFEREYESIIHLISFKFFKCLSPEKTSYHNRSFEHNINPGGSKS